MKLKGIIKITPKKRRTTKKKTNKKQYEKQKTFIRKHNNLNEGMKLKRIENFRKKPIRFTQSQINKSSFVLL